MPPNDKPAVEHRPPDRRKFLRTTAAGAGAALGLAARSYASVPGANDRVRIGFLGCGGRAQAHIHLITRLAAETGGVAAAAVCDVWDGLEEDYDHKFGGTTTRRRYSQGLYPSAAKCGLDTSDSRRVTKDYRRVLELKDVDAVCIATPDHWHARMTIDAMAAGKDVYVEKPMTRTPEEATAVQDAAVRYNRVVAVGVQTLADPVWAAAHDLIRGGRIGPVAHLSAGVFRNDARGQWRFYRLVSQMSPKTIDWDLFLGHQFDVNGVKLGPSPHEVPFDRAAFAQWRCYSPFSGGPFTDLYVHQVTRLLAATGLRFPGRVAGAGGLYQEHDGRTVPDVGTLVADFEEGCQLVVTGSTLTAYPTEEVVRGRFGAVKFVKGGFQVVRDDPTGGAGLPQRLERSLEPTSWVPVDPPKNETEALWLNFLDCVRRRDRNTLSSPDLGAAAVVAVALAQRGYRDGRVYAWDNERRTAVPADAAWAAKWEHRARTGTASLSPPEYMKLAGPKFATDEHG
ncbi:Gfo/Idh/MocA family protein [Fimbriiglobus ruber]|uniref:Myo-inositol 2-dehydrogenase n=1 Tax=Fimbriiglobus ruber TaxID=1908690 RepID=A0A225DCS0_9BACT|nr:Gfo/Idh/MocA family oxidoreductase [Fimbriiglobus ruber]OWK36338.1 Myo-inositol 2-dehydrogenase [Fimbriiglobus ruber]